MQNKWNVLIVVLYFIVTLILIIWMILAKNPLWAVLVLLVITGLLIFYFKMSAKHYEKSESIDAVMFLWEAINKYYPRFKFNYRNPSEFNPHEYAGDYYIEVFSDYTITWNVQQDARGNFILGPHFNMAWEDVKRELRESKILDHDLDRATRNQYLRDLQEENILGGILPDE